MNRNIRPKLQWLFQWPDANDLCLFHIYQGVGTMFCSMFCVLPFLPVPQLTQDEELTFVWVEYLLLLTVQSKLVNQPNKNILKQY